MSENPEDLLAQYRAEIDALDDILIEKLIARSHIVRKVGALKDGLRRSDHHLRPGREAAMLRRIAARFQHEAFSAEAATAIWRLIIGASTAIETDTTIAAYAPRESPDCYWLAREYWGAGTPIARYDTPLDALHAVCRRTAALAVLPPLEDGGPGAWWHALAEKHERGEPAPKIFARIPFVDRGANEPHALAVGFVTPEPTGDDVTLTAERTANGWRWRAMEGFRETAAGIVLGTVATPVYVGA